MKWRTMPLFEWLPMLYRYPDGEIIGSWLWWGFTYNRDKRGGDGGGRDA